VIDGSFTFPFTCRVTTEGLDQNFTLYFAPVIN